METTTSHHTPDLENHGIQARIQTDDPSLHRILKQLAQARPIRVSVDGLGTDEQDRVKPQSNKSTSPATRLPVLDQTGSRIRYLRVDQIDWFEAERQYVRIHVGTEKILTRRRQLTINNLASWLAPDQFQRVHRSHIVNLDRVEALRTDSSSKKVLEIGGGREVPVSQTYLQNLETMLNGHALGFPKQNFHS